MILKYLFPHLLLSIFVNGIFCQTDTLIIQTEITTQYIEYLTTKEIEWNNQINSTGDTDTPENMNAHMGLALIQFSKSQVNILEILTDVGPTIYNVDQYISDLNSYLKDEVVPTDSIHALFDAINNEIAANIAFNILTFSDSLNIWLQVNSWEMMTDVGPMTYNVNQYISDLNSYLDNEVVPIISELEFMNLFTSEYYTLDNYQLLDSIQVLFDAISDEIDANISPTISTLSDSLNIWLQVNSWEMIADVGPTIYNINQYISDLNSYLEEEVFPADSIQALFDAINNDIDANITSTISTFLEALNDGLFISNFSAHIDIVKNGLSDFTFNLDIQNYNHPIIFNREYFNNYNLLKMSDGMSNGIHIIADLFNDFYMNLDQIMDVALNPAYLDFSSIENELDLINMFKQSNPNWLNLTNKGIAWFHDAGAEFKYAFGEIASFFMQLTYLAENSDMTLNDDLYSIIDLLEQLDNDFADPTTSTIISGEHVNLSAWFDYPPTSFLRLWEDNADGNDNSLHCLFPDRSTDLYCDAECYSNEVNQDECGICGGNGPNGGEDCAGNPLSIDDNFHPENYSIHSIYPNPFNPVANITYGLPAYANVQIVVYDLAGKQVQTLVNGFQNAGYYSIYWNAVAYSSGMYFARMHANSIHGNEMSDYVKTKKMLLIK